MNKSKLIVIFTVFTFILTGSLLLSQIARKTCCIAGSYKGVNEDNISITCKKPRKGKFTLDLYQDKTCGTKVHGKIVDADGTITKFEGEVSPGLRGCCKIKGTTIPASPGDDVIVFSAELCKGISGKWKSKNGKYKNSNGCTGKFEISQI